VGSRERKREQRHKRKRRSTEAVAPAAARATGAPGGGEGGGDEPESFQDRISRRSEERNVKAREGLEPLAAGERPGAVTAGAAVSAILALIFTASAIVAAAGVIEVRGQEPSPIPLAGFAAVLWLMTWGMWKARYWAVLGFEMLLVLFMLSSALGLVGVSTVLQALGTLLLLLGSGALFYFMIRAMARIQMPERPG
jgi:hypothetical protein